MSFAEQRAAIRARAAALEALTPEQREALRQQARAWLLAHGRNEKHVAWALQLMSAMLEILDAASMGNPPSPQFMDAHGEPWESGRE